MGMPPGLEQVRPLLRQFLGIGGRVRPVPLLAAASHFRRQTSASSNRSCCFQTLA